jgi:hypothetical protein
MAALKQAMEARKRIVTRQPKKWTPEQIAAGEDKAARRAADERQAGEREYAGYCAYAAQLGALLALHPDPNRTLHENIRALVPELSLGDNNTIRDLQHYVAGPAPAGLMLDPSGHLDAESSFRYVDNFELLASQRVRNNPQLTLSPKPIDFIVAALPDTGSQRAYWIYGDEAHQLVILTDAEGNLALLRFERRRRELGRPIFMCLPRTTGTSMCASRILAAITEASSVFPRIRSGCWQVRASQ